MRIKNDNFQNGSCNIILVPGLVTIEICKSDTNSLFKNHKRFYGVSKKPLKFHFKIKKIRDKRFFSNAYKRAIYSSYNTGITDDDLFWYRRRFLFSELNFVFDFRKNIFYLNETFFYKMVFFRVSIGEYCSSQNLIKQLITLTLFLSGYMTCFGMSFSRKKDEVVTCIAPRDNGKTTFISEIVKREGVKYISENDIIIDLKTKRVFPTLPQWYVGKSRAKKLFDYLMDNPQKVHRRDMSFKKLFLLINTKKETSSHLKYHDYFFNCCAAFFSNPVARNYVMFLSKGETLMSEIKNNIGLMKRMHNNKALIVREVNNYNFGEVLFNKKKHDGEKYSCPTNKEGWERNVNQYEQLWRVGAKKWLSKRELGFIKQYLYFYLDENNKRLEDIAVLDIGVGAGRIVDMYLNDCRIDKIYGIDYAENMLDFVKDKFGYRVFLKKCDISKRPIPFNKKFDFISAIRVLKYSENWEEVVSNISSSLKPGGIFIFSMRNQISIASLSGDEWSSTTLTHLRGLLKKNNLKIIESAGFTRVPEQFYRINLLQDFVIFLETILRIIFPYHYLSKEMFIAVKKIE